jgi:DNA-binding LacI/PurR family transcriptional regulator
VERMSVTIKDIARLAKVSHTTVSRALNDSPLINIETKTRIKTIAKELNYVPNYSAKSLVLDKSYNIGLFFSTLKQGTSPSFFYEAVKGVNSVISDKYNLVVKGTDDYKDLSSINKKSFDGIIFMSQSINDSAFIYKIIEKEIPLIVLNTEIHANAVINIISDDYSGAYKAVELLIKNNHRNVAIIEGKKGFKSSQYRKEGYIQALIDNNIPMKKEYMVQGDYDIESGYECMLELLELASVPSAVFCSNDDMAVGAFKAIQEKGFKIPGDISVAGFDDNIFSKFLAPALTTVKRPVERMSIEGAKKLLSILEGQEVNNETLFIKTELVIRDSVSKI